MGRTLATLAIAAALAGCGGVKEDAFEDGYLAAYCSLVLDCVETSKTAALYAFDDTEDCEAFLGTTFGLATAACTYDKKKAKECLDTLETATCGGLDATFPACEVVYTGVGCPWAGQGTTDPTGTAPTPTDTATTDTATTAG